MSSEPKTQELLQTLLSEGSLPPADRALLDRRIRELDDETAFALDAVGAEALALALGARSDAAVTPPAKILRGSFGARHTAATTLVLALAASLAAVVLTPSLLSDAEPPNQDEGIKGRANLGPVRLLARRGVINNGVPEAGELLHSGAQVAANTSVLFRYRLSAPGWTYLLAQGDGSPRLLHAMGRQHAGEHEVSAGGQVLALRPAELGDTVTIVLLVAPRPLDGVDWSSLAAVNAASIEPICGDCSQHGLLLRTGARHD